MAFEVIDEVAQGHVQSQGHEPEQDVDGAQDGDNSVVSCSHDECLSVTELSLAWLTLAA